MLYLKNANYVDDQLNITNCHLAVEEGLDGGLSVLASLPAQSELKAGDKIYDCNGRLVMRGLVCGHHHIYSALSRGMPPAPRAPQNFVDVLELVWWRLDKCLDKDMTSASALACALALAKNGVTFCIDHHAAPYALDGSLSVIAEAFDRVGIGHLLCYEGSCRDGKDIALASLAEHDRYLSSGGKGHVGLHASFTVDDELLNGAVALAKKHGTGLHIHVAEAASDQEHCLATYGKTVVRRLKDAGALDLPQTILGHCVHVSAEDRAILAASPCWIAQNVESNQNNNVGLAGYAYSDNVIFGTDGMHSDMIRSAQSAYFSGIGVEGLSVPAAYTRLRNAHRHTTLHGACGDGANNLTILDYASPTPVTQANFLGHFFYGLDNSQVGSVVSQGRLIVEDGRLTTCDEAEILKFANEQAKRLWEKLI